MRSILVLCALCAAACGGSDRPPQDPSSTTSSSGTAVTGASTSGSSYATPTSSTTPSTAPAAATVPPAASPTMATTPSTDPAPAMGGATVTNNPGAADQTAGADNTRMNQRDRHDTLTPMNQGNSSDEIKISAAIRKGMMADKSLSFMAKNIKVITVGTKVTLRGPVKTDAEKASIEARARQTPGVTDVDDQLEVKP